MKITIEHGRCNKDGMCVKVCPAQIFVQRERLTIPELSEQEYCISCGQCVAVCSSGAIIHADFPQGSINPIDIDKMPTVEQATMLLKTRRSIRAFRDKPVEKEIIEQIIEGARFAPSGHNYQSTEFLVVRDKAIISKISELIIEYFKFECRRLENPIFRTMALLTAKDVTEAGLKVLPEFRRMIHTYKDGEDPILHRAPVLVAFHAQRNVVYADINAHLALQNASLVAHSLGIGSFFTGWAFVPCIAPMARSWNVRIPNLLGIPPENRMHGALALGYPVPKFRNWIDRKPANIKWVE